MFWLELPLSADVRPRSVAPPVANTAEMPEAKPIPARPLHLLVVDDVLMSCDVADALLRAAGHTVTCVESGAEAITAVSNTDFDVVLMDVRMPEMDGLEATRRIRALEGGRGRVPIIASTAHAFTEQVEECRAAGMDGHLSKPFNLATLLAAVARAVNAARSPNETPTREATPVALAIPVAGTELQIFDPLAFDRTANVLAPMAVIAHLRTIANDGEALLGELRKKQGPRLSGNEFAEAAHNLAGGAGMFGFARLAASGSNFERATRSDAPDTPVIADALGAAIEATLPALRERIASTVAA